MARARVTLRWTGKKVEDEIRRDMVKRLYLIGEFVASEIRKDLSTSTRANGPSAPGEPPHLDTGKLRQSISYSVDESRMIVRIGTPLKYGLWLEFGTSDMDARPVFRPAGFRLQREIKKILTKKLGRGGVSGFFKVSSN